MKTARSLSVIAVVIAGAAAAQTVPDSDAGSESRVSPAGPYRSKVRVLERDVAVGVPPDPQELLQQAGDDAYGKALVHRRLAFDAARDQDYTGAITHFEQALEQHSLAAPVEQQMRANLAELYVATEQYDRMIEALERWRQQGTELAAKTWASGGIALLRQDRFRAASEALERALAAQSEAPPQWREWLLYALQRQKRFDEAAAIKSDLMDLRTATRRDWLMLASLYQHSGTPELATAVMEVAWRVGQLTTDNDLITLANLYLVTGLPARAATLLETELAEGRVTDRADHLLLLAKAYLSSGDDEAAVAPLARAANDSDDAATYFQLGKLQHHLGQMAAARDSVRRATRGDLGAETGKAYLLLGEIHVALDETAAARRAFEKASALGGSYRAAIEWLDRLDAQKTKQTAQQSISVQPAIPFELPRPRIALPASIATKTVASDKYFYVADRLPLIEVPNRTAQLARRLSIAVRRERLEVSGPLHLFFLSEPGAGFDDLELQVALPVRYKAPPRGKFRSRTTEPFLCVPKIHEGSLDELASVWQQLFDEIDAAGLKPSGESRMVIIELSGLDRGSGRFELQLGVLPPATSDRG